MTTLLAHIGFESSSDIAIETIIDVVDHFLRRMTLLLKAAVEQKDHGFPVREDKCIIINIYGIPEFSSHFFLACSFTKNE